MKKIMFTILVMFLFVLNIDAGNTIHYIDMEIYIDNDGTAHVKEEWNIEVNEGTEGFKAFAKSKDNYNIKNVFVRDVDHEYGFVEPWNIDASFTDKINKYGLNETYNDIEICWGLSKYGQNTYTINYEIENFLKQYNDAQVVYFKLLDNMNPSPLRVTAYIYSDMKFDKDNTKIWAFGYEGNIYFYDGAIYISSHEPPKYVVPLIKVENDYFTPTTGVNRDFEDLYEEATKDSDYTNEKNSSIFEMYSFIVIFFVVIFALIVVIIVFTSPSRYKKQANKKKNINIPKEKEVEYYREIIYDKDIYIISWLAIEYNFSKNGDILGAMLLKLVFKNKIEIEETKKKTFFGSSSYNIILHDDIIGDNEYEDTLIYYLKDIALGKNKISDDDFSTWCIYNNNLIRGFVASIHYRENVKALKRKEITYAPTEDTYLSYVENKKMTDITNDNATKLLGLKKFLLNFTNIEDKGIMDVHMLEEYLIVADILGIADKVSEQFKEIYPDFSNRVGFDVTTAVSAVGAFSASTLVVGYSSGSSHDSSGGGGSSSSGGGSSAGGSSGGGTR